jgi:hypothetical protein
MCLDGHFGAQGEKIFEKLEKSWWIEAQNMFHMKSVSLQVCEINS